MSIRAPSLPTTAASRLSGRLALGAFVCLLAPLGCVTQSPSDSAVEGDVAEASQAVSSFPTSFTQFPISIRASANQQYISATSGAGALAANTGVSGPSERFQVHDLGGGNVALRSLLNGKYVTALAAGSGSLTAVATAVGDWEKFQFVPLGGTNFALKALVNGKYVCANDAGWGPIIANRTAVGSWETFSWMPSAVLQNQTAFRAAVNGKFVSAISGGADPLKAAGPAPASWEAFQIKDLGNGNVAIKAIVNNLWVSALSAGAGPLKAAGPAPSSWETFQWVPLDGNNFALKSLTNNLYVSATSAGNGALTANASAVGPWETFRWTVPSEPKSSTTAASSTGVNLAKGKYATQTGDWVDNEEGQAWRAVDGSTDGDWGHGSVTHTALRLHPSWQVDLGASQPISSVVLHNRTDCCSERLQNFSVLVSNDGNQWSTAATYPGIAPPRVELPVTGDSKFVRVELNSPNPDYLSLAEVEVMSRSMPAFDGETTYNFGNTVTNTFTGDFNGDGIWDIGVTGTSAENNRYWTIRYGDGHGSFGNETSWYWGNGSFNVFTGDFDGDGIWDIGVTGGQYDSDRNWYIMYGDGLGTFGRQTVWYWGNGVTKVFTGDFDGDGKWDIGATGGPTEGDRNMYIRYGNGDGTFGRQTIYYWANRPNNIFTGDFDGDGKWDIGATGTAGEPDRSFHIRFGDGRGNFGSEAVHNWGNTVTNVFTGDFNGDHRWDIGVTGTASEPSRAWTIRYNRDKDAPPTRHDCGPATGIEAIYPSDGQWGDTSDFAAGYHAKAGIGGVASTGHDAWVGAKADANVSVFGNTATVLDIGAEAIADGSAQSSRGWVRFLGMTLLDQPLTIDFDFHPTETFIEAEETFYEVVTVRAAAVGTYGVTGQASITPTGISVRATPSMDIALTASVSIGAWCASAGVYGQLNLVKVAVPSMGSVNLFDKSRGWAFDSDLEVTSLDGHVWLEADYCFGSASTDIYSWSGFSSTDSLLHANGCL